MASTDARPIPRKNVAYRVTFPILDADGDLVTGVTSPDSEVSIDGGAFADCTNEATEIATNSGMYFLDLTQAEMNGDTVSIIVKSGSGKTTPIVLYPEEAGDVRVDVVQISGDSGAADNAEAFFDGTGYAGTNNVIPTVTTLTNLPAITANWLTAAGLAADAVSEIQSGLATSAALDIVDNFLDTEIAAIVTAVVAIETGTQDIQSRIPAALVGGRMDSNMQAAANGVITAAVIADGAIDAATFAVGAIDAAAIATDALGSAELAASWATEIADAVLSRSVSNVEASAGEHTLCTIVLAMLESSVSSSVWTIKRTDGVTTHASKPVTSDASADPITGVS